MTMRSPQRKRVRSAFQSRLVCRSRSWNSSSCIHSRCSDPASIFFPSICPPNAEHRNRRQRQGRPGRLSREWRHPPRQIPESSLAACGRRWGPWNRASICRSSASSKSWASRSRARCAAATWWRSMAAQPTAVVIGELKLTFTLDLVLQAVDRSAACDEVWLAVRASRRGRGREHDPQGAQAVPAARLRPARGLRRRARSRCWSSRCRGVRGAMPSAARGSSRSTDAARAIPPRVAARASPS